MGIASQEVEQAEEFVKAGFELTDRIISNGDFYPRNLIRLQDRVVLVDWAHWVGYRVCFVDYLANVAAFAYVHCGATMLGRRILLNICARFAKSKWTISEGQF